ncbi:(2Fe-2S) ferredoxin domain-containing protein [Synechococcales cyanobacterium C]|uniref:(2Fe-2S) ferredoxin domain-containing protein n=1 Tax=Petrachloros mirabilis ULC683 TaxID=2781853 RepID=A0A8K2A933_9CYAN|nr:(2Fe-2S) ferredoxin domain-containing protein [Petrachloros mirabilis]NCJ07824.1 (2Fe-2S) ferredoxin domain-containing protein [Petrachloros mirabilis ULC683]
MSSFQQRVTPLNRRTSEPLARGGQIEYEEFPATIEVLGPLLYWLFHDHWSAIGLGHMVDGSVLELEFTQAPKIIRLYDGYLTVVTEGWHMHLCLEENQGGPLGNTPPDLRQKRLVHRAALYRRLNAQGQARSWGIQFWNGAGERMMNLFLPNPFVGEEEDLLPEHRPNLEKLRLYDQVRQIFVLGEADIPYETNPLQRPYLSVCRSGRCYPSRQWQPVYEALQGAVAEQGLDVEVIHSGCLEVCKLGPVVFYSGDRTWYTRVTPAVAEEIVQTHVVQGKKLQAHVYPKDPSV